MAKSSILTHSRWLGGVILNFALIINNWKYRIEIPRISSSLAGQPLAEPPPANEVSSIKVKSIILNLELWILNLELKKPCPQWTRLIINVLVGDYIIPPIPPAGIGGTGFASFFSASTHSVVRNIDAIDAAFSNATRETLVGSMIPAASISS